MVETSTLSDNQIDAMMKRIHSVPIIDVPRAKKWDGIFETFHGGLLGTIADTVTCWAILTVIGSEAKVATTDFNIRFLRPCNTDVRCVARVIKAGRTMSLSEAELYDSENNLVAVAQVNYIKLD
ncbi:MAG: PaaI family thioesterase [Euryarchaeota archaeon]